MSEGQTEQANPDSGNEEQAVATQFENLSEEKSAESVNPDEKMDLILDIPVRISVEIGRTTLNIRNLLQLNQGSIVELDRLAGDPLDIMVNGVIVAHGEVVVVNDKFGVRLTDVISTSERIKKLK